MAANTEDLGKLVTTAIAPKVAEYGLSLPEFYIENISLPEEVEKAMDKRTSMGVVGDLSKYMQYNAAEAMANPASAAAAAMQTGLGAAMGMQMGAGQAGPWGAAAAPTPPPPPAARTWHVAANGATMGPFGEDALPAMVADGRVTRATMVWSAGMDGWKAAGDTDLARLFAMVPPPLPPGV
jgi:GYF domain 2/SPFH domain-Band 7 family